MSYLMFILTGRSLSMSIQRIFTMSLMIVASLVLCNSCGPGTGYVTIERLLTNNMERPLGIDEVPVFGWTISSNIIGLKQVAYQIRIYVDSNDGALVWDTGRIDSNKSANVELDYSKSSYLSSETDYVWNVTVWDNYGGEHEADGGGRFLTGLAYELRTQGYNSVKEITFGEDAVFIGHPDITLDAASLTVYRISYDFQITKEGARAGFVYGANEFRMSNAMYNDFLVEGENYINVVVDISQLKDSTGPAQVKVYRKGYGPYDYRQANNTSLLGTFDLANLNRDNMNERHSIALVCSGANISEGTLDGLNFISEFEGTSSAARRRGGFIVNPTGLALDMCKYPRLGSIGFYADQDAVFSNVSVQHFNLPRSEVFGSETGATYDIFRGLEGVTVNGDEIHVSNTLVYADPSYGSMPMVRNTFEPSGSSDIIDAKLYVTSRGVNQFYINGNRVDSHVIYHADNEGREHSRDYLSPGMLQFYGTMRYTTYDVTDMLNNRSTNAMGAVMAPGWWGDEYFYSPIYWNWYGDRWGLLAKLVITYSGGTKQEIVTNEDEWRAYLDGPITYSSLYHGEYYDARKEANVWTDAYGVNGWSTVEYDDYQWTRASYIEAAHENFDNPDYAGRVDYPAHVVEVLRGDLVNTPSTKFGNNPKRVAYIYDMGENMVGVPEIRFNRTLPEGAVVTLRFGEIMIDGDYAYPENASEMDGMIYTENYRGARSLDRYIAKGSEGGETYSPTSTFHGYQFVEVSIMSDELTNGEVESIMRNTEVLGLQLSSINKIASTFESSNDLLDRFYLNVARSFWDNHVYVPTDCPQRNERLGFLGDQQVFSETAVYFGDMTQFYHAFAQQARDYQVNSASRNYAYSLHGRGSYLIKEGVPYNEDGWTSNIAWPLGGLTMAWDVLANNSNLKIVRDHWDSMVMFVQQFINAGRHDKNYEYLFRGGGLSNWLETSVSSDSGYDQIVTFGRTLMYMATMADALGYDEEAVYYREYFDGLKAEFNEHMISAEGIPLTYNGEEHYAQSSYAIALYYGMVDLDKHPNFVKNYVERCRHEGTEITTNVSGVDMQLSEYSVTSGFTGTPCILGALAINGEFYTAYRMLENENYASWLYPVTLGATSIWERWDGLTGHGPNSQTMNSFNHYPFGVAAAFMITTSAGIQRGDNGEFNPAGFQDFVLQPSPGGSLEYVRGTYDSSSGTIESSWEANPDVVNENGISDMIFYSTVVPANTSATLYLPLGQTINESSLEGFQDIAGVALMGITKRNNIYVAEFRLGAGGYDFRVRRGTLVASLQRGFVEN